MIPSFGQPLINNEDPTRVNLPLQMETALINGLEEYHVYRFSVYFETGAGRSSSSNFITVETSSIGIIMIQFGHPLIYCTSYC